jgi:hypothetical protein
MTAMTPDSERPAKNRAIAGVTRQAMIEGRYRLTTHVIERMRERDVDQLQIKDVLLNGRRENDRDRYSEKHHAWSYSWRGGLEDGRELRVVVVEASPGILVVTVVDLSFTEDQRT